VSPPHPNVTSALLRVPPSHDTPNAPGAAWRRRQWGLGGESYSLLERYICNKGGTSVQELTSRQLLDREIVRYTSTGWQIVSQSESGFQVVLPHVVSAGMVALFVIAPMILGVLVSLFSVVFGTALFSLALLLAALLALDHLTKKPQLLYITADRLRALTPAAVVTHNASGVTVCSVCQKPAQADATECAHCKVAFVGA